MRGAPFEARLEAAVAGGFAGISVFPTDCPDLARAREIRALCEERAVRVTALDPFTRWLPDWQPPQRMPGDLMALVGCGEEDFYARAEALGATSMTVLEPFGRTYPTEVLVSSFASLCDRAAGSGLRVHLEFTPFSGISDLAFAWQIVAAADRHNGGLVFDTWHYLRGRTDPAVLAALPGELIFVVQVSDAAAEPTGTLIEDTMRHRRLPGDGDWDLAGVLSVLLAKPALGEIGIEVLSEELAALAPTEVGARCAGAMRTLLAQARARSHG